MDTPLHDFSGLSERTIDLLWFAADKVAGNRELAFEAVLALHRAELKIDALTHRLATVANMIADASGRGDLETAEAFARNPQFSTLP